MKRSRFRAHSRPTHKSHCHCGFDRHLAKLRARKLSFLGIALFIAHLLFHVVECLILPSALVALGGHLHEHSAAAAEPSAITSSAEDFARPAFFTSLVPELSDYPSFSTPQLTPDPLIHLTFRSSE